MNTVIFEGTKFIACLRYEKAKVMVTYSNPSIVKKEGGSYKLDCQYLVTILKEWITEKDPHSYNLLYCSNLTIIGAYLITDDYFNEYFELKSFINKSEVFSIEARCRETGIVIGMKNIEKLLGTSYTNFDDPKDKEDLNSKLSLEKIELMKIKHIFQVFFSDINLNMQYYSSISKISRDFFFKNYNEKKIKLELLIEDDAIFRQSYFGGRCEIFSNTIEEGNIFHFDFKNMYASVMTDEFPIQGYTKILRPKKIKNIGFYYVRVRSEKKQIPVLPHEKEDSSQEIWEDDKRTTYVNGVFQGLYWYEELLLFIEEGGVIEEIMYAYIWTKKDYTFKSFIDYCVNKREEGGISKILWKNLITSFYGRLGMAQIKTKTIVIKLENYLEEAEKHGKDWKPLNETWINNFVIIELPIPEEALKKKTVKSNVIYASIITSKARIKLYKGIRSVSENGGKVLYCDTDSIFAKFDRDVEGETHGEIEWSAKQNPFKILKAVFANVRNYSIVERCGNEVTKIAGSPRNSVSYDKFFKAFYLSSQEGNNVSINVTKKIFNHWEWNFLYCVNLNKYNSRCWNTNKTKTRPWYKIDKTYIVDKEVKEY